MSSPPTAASWSRAGRTKYLGKFYNERFWSWLAALFRRPEFIRCLYDHLASMDLTGVDWKQERKANLTKSYYQLAALYSPIEAVYFEEMAQKIKAAEANHCGDIKWDDVDWPYMPTPLPETQKVGWGTDTRYYKLEIYRKMKDWAKARGYYQKMEPTPKQFYNRLDAGLDMPLRLAPKYGGDARFEFDPAMVHDHVVDRKWVDNDESVGAAPPTIEAFCKDFVNDLVDRACLQSDQDAYMNILV